MKHKPVAGLVGAGGVNRSFLARMPTLLGNLGPVKAASLRVARRIANTLGAGYAVSDYAALEPCELIWIAVPDPLLDRAIRELAAAVKGTTVVLCGSMRDSRSLAALRTAGARVASLNVVDESKERTLLAEGDPEAMRMLRRVATSDDRNLIEICPASKALYFAGVHLSTHLLLPWIAGAMDSLRAAGLSRAEAARLSVALGTRTLRAYGKAGQKAWNSSSARQMQLTIERNLETIRSADPRLAALSTNGIVEALKYFERGA